MRTKPSSVTSSEFLLVLCFTSFGSDALKLFSGFLVHHVPCVGDALSITLIAHLSTLLVKAKRAMSSTKSFADKKEY
jgi:hypothetical protein